MPIETTKILKPHLIVCEGRDAFEYLIKLLAFLTQQDPRFDEFQVFNFNGNSQLAGYIETLKNMPGYERVTSMAVIRDAETDATAAMHSIANAFARNILPEPQEAGQIVSSDGIKTGFVLFPACGGHLENGTLEDLCLRSLAGSDVDIKLEATDDVVNKFTFGRKHKNRLHTYLSLTDAYVSMKLGEACKAQAFRFDIPQIDSLKEFLLRFLP